MHRNNLGATSSASNFFKTLHNKKLGFDFSVIGLKSLFHLCSASKLLLPE